MAGGCTASDTVIITVAGSGTNTIVNATICTNSTYTLPNGTIVSAPGTYIDTISAAGGCFNVITTNLANGAASVNAGSDVSICSGGSTQLNATGGLIYAWTPTTGLSNANIANPLASPAATTAYVVSSQIPLGNLIVNGDFSAGNTGFTSGYAYTPPPNSSQGQYWVSTNAQPWNGGMAPCGDHTTGTGNMLLVNGATTANVSVWCETINVIPNTDYAFSTWLATLTASNPAQLQFSINGALLGPVFTASITNCIWQQFYSTWNSGANTTASICVVNQNTIASGNDFALDDISFSPLCTGTDTVIVTVNNPDTVILNPAICQGAVYTFPDGTTSNVSTIDTTYLLNQYGCDSNIITNLTVNPSFTANVPVTICYGTSYVLPSGVTENTSGVFTDTLFTVAGCDSIIITNLTVTPPPVTPVFDTICANQTFTRPSGIVVSTAGVYVDTLVAPGGCDSVVITNLTVNPISATTVFDTICSGASFTLPNGNTVNTSGSYPVTLSNQFGCDSVVTNILTVINVSLVASETDILCNGQSTGTIGATATGGLQPYNYQLTLNGAPVSNNATGSFNGLAAGSYVVDVTDNFGCTATTNITINQPPALQISDSAVNVSCYGLRDGSITVNALGGTQGYTYALNGQTNSSGIFSPLDTGTYEYGVTDANGCADSGAATISQPVPVNISIAPDSLVMDLGKSLQLNAGSNYDPNAHYLWTPAFGLSCYTCPNPIVKINSTASYNVLVTVNINGNNCTADTNITVTVIPNYNIFIPNTFSPNGDGNNDYFQLFGNLPAMKFIDMQVFDRWGEKVFESNDIYFKWDGNYKGKPVPPGVLVYTLRVVFDDDHTEKLFTGSLTVLR